MTVLLARLKLPHRRGYLLAAGAVMGPYGLGLITSVHDIEVLAEVGWRCSSSIGPSLFSRPAHLPAGGAGRRSPGGASPRGRRVAICRAPRPGLGAATLRLRLPSPAPPSSCGRARRAVELDAPHGRFIVGTLIFQDPAVPMVPIVPLLGPSAGGALADVGIALGKAAAVVVAVRSPSPCGRADGAALGGRQPQPRGLLLAILTLCIDTAWLTRRALLALGAFLGGMVVADTEYGHRAMGDILPLRDAFVSLFFVMLGMLFDFHAVLSQPLLVAAMLAGFLAAKGLIATLAASAMRFPARVAWLAGVGLAQFGEFGFVLTRLAEANGVISDASPLLAAGILSMFLTPLLVRVAPHIRAGEKLLAPLERLIGLRAIDEEDEGTQGLRDHVVLVGYGVAGIQAAQALRATGAPFVILELSGENVRRGREAGMPVYYGDATSEEALRHAHLLEARLVVLLINDPRAAERVVDTIRRVAPQVPVLMRVRYLGERPRLLAFGAHDVVAEEVEGAAEIVARMLRHLEVPRNTIDARIRDLRSETQTSERSLVVPRRRLGEVRGLDALKIESASVEADSPVIGASIVDLRLRSETGALVVGVRRGDELLDRPDPTVPFEVGDVVYMVGTGEALERALGVFAAR
ncbi:MAG: cation:proton antiporter [bacterium]